MCRNDFYIAHQPFHILKDMMVDTLQTVRSLSYPLRRNHKRIINKPDPQRLRFFYFIPNSKMI